MRRLNKTVECEQQKTLSPHERLVGQHANSVRSICRRVEKTAAAVERWLQAVYSQCTCLDRQVGERPKCLRECTRGELKAVGVKCAQYMGD